MMKKIFFAIIFLASSWAISAQVSQITGEWITVEGKTQESLVKIFKATNGKYYGQTLQVLVPGQENSVCTKCGGAEKDHPIAGLTIIRDMEVNGNHLSGGKILDPKRGKWFDCIIKMDGKNLSVRGFVGPFGETKTWIRKQ